MPGLGRGREAEARPGSLRAGTIGDTGLVAISATNPLAEANAHTVCSSL